LESCGAAVAHSMPRGQTVNRLLQAAGGPSHAFSRQMSHRSGTVVRCALITLCQDTMAGGNGGEHKTLFGVFEIG
jgi:hypothetical protein